MAYVYEKPTLEQRGGLFCKARHDTYPEIDSSTQSNHTGHTIFITGASKGIGRATAICYVKAGASQIAIAARSDLSDVEADMLQAAKEAGKPEPKVLKIKLDVQDRQSVLEAGNLVRKEFGRLDVVINNAGYLPEYTKFLEADEEAFWRTWEINMRGVYWVTKEFLPLLIETSSGLQTIVNVSSVGALNLVDGGGAYQVSKFAVLRFTEFTCVDYADKGIVAYAVHPGGIPTELSRNMPSNMRHLLIDTLELAADTMVYLTQEKRTWLAGRYLSCNWDMPEFFSKKEEIIQGNKLKMRMVF